MRLLSAGPSPFPKIHAPAARSAPSPPLFASDFPKTAAEKMVFQKPNFFIDKC
jgi:hypothetical protein